MEENKLSIIIQSIEKQLAERLEKLWRVFNWSASILLGITGGIIVFGKKGEHIFTSKELSFISFIIILITLYAWFWIDENLKLEKQLRDQLDEIFDQKIKYSKWKEARPDKVRFGYKIVILLLGAVSMLATWAEKLAAN